MKDYKTGGEIDRDERDVEDMRKDGAIIPTPHKAKKARGVKEVRFDALGQDNRSWGTIGPNNGT